MQNPWKLLCYSIIFMTIFLGWSSQTFGQNKVGLSLGVGLPEFLNVGGRYQLEQAQIGISYGTIPVEIENIRIFSISSHYYYHFGGTSELSNIRPWYGKGGFTYVLVEDEDFINNNLFFNFRIGRAFNITRKFRTPDLYKI